MRSSSDWVRDKSGSWQRAKVQQTRGLNLSHNHQLKAIFKGAATTILMQWRDDPLYRDYQRLLDGGTKPNLAKVTVARKVAAIVLSMWKAEEVYDPAKKGKPISQ
jgi:transposase